MGTRSAIPRDPWIGGGRCTAEAGYVGEGMGCRGIGIGQAVTRMGMGMVVGASVSVERRTWCTGKGAGTEAGSGKRPCTLAFGLLLILLILLNECCVYDVYVLWLFVVENVLEREQRKRKKRGKKKSQRKVEDGKNINNCEVQHKYGCRRRDRTRD